LSDEQVSLLHAYATLLLARNRFVNLVSRSLTPDDLWRHIEHSLALRLRRFPDGAQVVDWGSGGGLPAVPLAIAIPHIRVTAIDATLKKVNAVTGMAAELGLTNVAAVHSRAEAWGGSTNYSVARATASLATLWRWHSRVQDGNPPWSDDPDDLDGYWKPGLIAFKGGRLGDEIKSLRKQRPRADHEVIELEPLLGKAFEEKVLISVVAAK
jgi:16S rRNA (guanine527-N7)-methyltransferase